MRKLVALLLTSSLTGLAAAQATSVGNVSTARLGSCPRGALTLSRADLPAAKRVVLRFATHEFIRRSPDLDPAGAYVSRALLGRVWAKGGFIKTRCGGAVWRRTAVVAVTYPAMFRSDTSAPGPCNSCAGVEFLASPTRAGWVVWYAL